MGTKEKLIERFKNQPKDFTFDEMEKLLFIFGYVKSDKGKTFWVKGYIQEWEQKTYHVT